MPGQSDQLAAILAAVAAGEFPPPDGAVTVVPQPSARDAGVFGFTAHHVVFADVDPAWVKAQLPEGDLSAPMLPSFLAALAEATGRRANSHDLLCVCPSLPGPPPLPLAPLPDSAHPRVARAWLHRDQVRVWASGCGLVLLGRGVAGRWEVAVEVDPAHRGHGLGRALAAAARHLVPDGEHLWAQIAPGNAASVRAFLAAGFVPAGAEALLVTHERERHP